MLHRDFYSFAEFRDAIGSDDEAVRQALLRGELTAFLELKDENAKYINWNSASVAPRTGSSAYASWQAHWRPADPEGEAGACEEFFTYTLNGWFAVEENSLREAARKGSFHASPHLVPPKECAKAEDGDFFDLNGPRYRTKKLKLDDLWFSQSAIARLSANARPIDANSELNRALDGRERKTLLRIIRALSVLAKLPERGAAPSVLKKLQELGFTSPGDTVIREKLEQARALEPD